MSVQRPSDQINAATAEVRAKRSAAFEPQVADWLVDERVLYAHAKWSPPDAAAAHLDCVMRLGPTMWDDWAGNYIKRAVLFGLDTPQGRQALGKAVVTLTHVLETAVELYGPMPLPGVPSGVIEGVA